MRSLTIGLLLATTALASACSPGPGSPEWCKGVIQGTTQASMAELEAHGAKCEAVMREEMMKGLNGALGQ